MPLPRSIKPADEVWVVYTKVGPYDVRDEREDAEDIADYIGKGAVVRKYKLVREGKRGN